MKGQQEQLTQQYFNPRSRTGSDAHFLLQRQRPENFNPRSRTGSDRRYGDVAGERQLISTHAPAQGATNFSRLFPISIVISTHAPAQGATDRYFRLGIAVGISTHAPAQGATSNRIDTIGNRTHFNPRSRTGSDWNSRTFTDYYMHFNPRSRTGSDGYVATATVDAEKFQPTLPHRERQTTALAL